MVLIFIMKYEKCRLKYYVIICIFKNTLGDYFPYMTDYGQVARQYET